MSRGIASTLTPHVRALAALIRADELPEQVIEAVIRIMCV